MIDLDHKAAMERYLFAPKGKRVERLNKLRAITKALLQSPKQKKRRRRG